MSQEQDRFSSPHSSPTVTRALPNILRQVKENSLAILSNQLSEFFNSCDDLFFELANHAGSNNEQNLYFDSMREIRLKKKDVVGRFKDNFNASFSELTTTRTLSNVIRDNEEARFESLDLVENDKMEQDVAISTIVSKTRQDCQESLYHLTLRFDYLLKDIQVSESNLPLDPRQICECFTQASSQLELNIKVRVILLKQFDRMVARHLNKIYNLANELLINAGILPKVTPNVRKKPERSGPPNANKSNAAPNSEQDQADKINAYNEALASNIQEQTSAPINSSGYDFNQLAGLLQSVRNTNSPEFIAATINTAGNDFGGAISQESLIEQLHALQQIQKSQAPLTKEQFQQSIYQILHTSGDDGKPSSLDQSDEDVINLVSMFFEFILDDRNLPVPIQALISRLQIPILKVALKDKTFFNNSQHTSRLLINEIASASIGWNDSDKSQQDSLYKLINEIVHKVNDEFEGDLSVFEHELERLKQHKQIESNRSKIVEQRTNQAAEGKAKTDHAKSLVQEILLQRLSNQELPEVVSNFLINHWQKVLLLVKLKSGDNSPEWLNNLQVVDDLIWVMHEHKDEKSKVRAEKIASKVFNDIEQGLGQTSTSTEEQQSTIESLKRAIPDNNAEIPSSPIEKSKLKVEQLAALGQKPKGLEKPWEEMSALERQKVKQQALQVEFLKKAEELEVGTWFLFNESSVKQIRFKLASYIKPNERFIFVNRYGQKLFEKSKNEVALELQKKLLVPLENGLLFDRAMSRITNNLKLGNNSKADTSVN